MRLPLSPIALTLSALLAACSEAPESTLAVETVALAPLELVLEAEGQLRSQKATPLLVPGAQWAQRQVIWMKADGSRVEAGEVVARFSATQGELELSKALLDLRRNALSRAAKQDELGALQGRVDVDLAQVGSQLAIAQRYADAELEMFARNEILDAIQDEQFLIEKRDVLSWKRDQSGSRGETELAVLDSQRATFDLNAARRRADLDALELRAPNAGVLVLSEDWSGEKPKLGASVWAGNEFASLPDTAALEVELSLPQIEAQGAAVGIEVELHPVGRPEQRISTTLTWIAGAAAVRSRQSPVKYLLMKADVPSEAAQRHGWVPGQAFRARLFVARAGQGISVPNVALQTEADRTYVQVQAGAGIERREVRLGARGPARSEVRSGLAPGDRVVLAPAEQADT